CTSSDVVNGCVTTRTLVYTARDACNNTTTCARTFTWTTDTTPPTFDNCVGGNTDLGCNPTVLPKCDAGVTATDNCGPAKVTCASSDVVNGCVTTRTLVYTASDACNNQTSCTQTFTWTTDTTPPTFDNCVSGNTDLGCNPTNLPVCDPGVTASDNCGPATVTCTSSDVVNGCVTTRTLVYTARDACNNTTTCARTFTWTTDTTPPTFNNCVSGNTDLGCNPTNLPVCDPGVTASDNCGPAAVTCTSSDVVNGCVTTRTLVYTARDACNNTTTCARTFTWTTDTTPPTFDNCVSGNTDLGPNPTVIPGCDAGITASDNCGSATVTCAFTDSSTGCSNVRTVTYTARDACGNTATCTRTYTWGAAGQICATKYYDANANGVRDPGEPGIPGWKFRLSDGQTGFTDANGRVCFNSTGAGTYTVTELSPIQNNWAATTPTTCQVTISASNCSAECSFGNYCFSNPSRGLTIGYWRNKNGRRVLEQNDPAWRTLLNSLNLRKADGSLFTVPTSGSFSNAFDAWAVYLQGANATNMAYMLSAQLGATSLNVAFNGLSDATTIIVPGGVKSGSTCLVPFLSTTQAIVCGAPPLLTLTGQPGSSACGCNSNNGATTIGNLRNRAVCLLGTYNVTTSAGTPRTYEECVKNLLDMINNNGNNGSPCGGLTQYVNPSSTNCPITFP
ncbi:MAG: hypothetical protein JNL28_17545, partial [Planctomycetes bacterium]|nr:hypothetical protein [Planctomycetota bacterium]